ncbi:MAG: polyprenol monophosphomannose synthase [Patescibacteria group bacterium]
MSITIVIPTYNERENIEILISRIAALHIPEANIIVVDDASPDGTGAVVTSLHETYPFVSLIARNGKRGLGSAYVEGFTRALAQGADIIIEMDADLSHAPEDIPRLLSAIDEGADVAIGSRRVPGGQIVGWHWRRHLASTCATWLSRALLGFSTRDITSGFRAFRRSALIAIHFADVRSDGYAFQEEMLLRCERGKFIITEIPVVFTDRVRGESKLGVREVISFFITLMRLWIHRH